MHSEKPWYKTSFRRNLIDMHINDADERFLAELDAKAYVDLLVKARVDTAILYASSCLGICYWPAPAGHVHRGLRGRDWVAEVLAECKKREIRPVLYLNFWSKWAYEHHPDWRTINIDGLGTLDYLWHPGRYGVCCLNSPYREFFLALVRDLCSRYEAEGLWVDMIGWLSGVCYCGHCRRRYFEETGRQIPTQVDWASADWVRFQRKREEWAAELVETVTKLVKSLRPGMSVAYQSAGWTQGWYAAFSQVFLSQSDYLAGDFYGKALNQSVICKALNNLSKNRPIEFMVSRAPDLSHHTTRKTPEQLSSQAYSALAHQASFVFIDAIDPLGTLDAGVYEEMGRIYQEIERYERHLDPDATMLADVAIYFNLESMISLKENKRRVPADLQIPPLYNRLHSIARALIHGNILYDVVTDRNLDALDRYQVVILPEIPVLKEREIAAFRRFVEGGGSLYVSGESGILTPWGEQLADFALSELLGVSRVSGNTPGVTYVAPVEGTAGGDLLVPYTRKYPLMLSGPQVTVKAKEGAKVLATVTLPYTDPADPTALASAISNPPGVETQLPSLVLHTFGKGRTMYAAGKIEDMDLDGHRTVFIRLVRSLFSRRPFIETNAPKPVEITLFRHDQADRLILCALNYQAEQPNLPVYDVHISVLAGGDGPRRVVRLPEGSAVEASLEDDRVSFKIDRLDTFAMFAIE